MTTFTLLGRPVPKARPRIGKNGRVYTPSATKEAESMIGWFWRVAGGTMVDGDVKAVLEFHCPDRRKVDVDNLTKTVLDALNGLAYRDDAQITRLEVDKHLGCDRPRTVVSITPAEPFGSREENTP